MKKYLLILIMLLSLGACQSKPRTAEFSCLSDLGYTLNREVIPTSMNRDVYIWEDEHTTQIQISHYQQLDAEPSTAFVLQAIPAGTTEVLLDGTVYDVAQFESQKVFENHDIMVYECYELVYENEENWVEQVEAFYEKSERTAWQYVDNNSNLTQKQEGSSDEVIRASLMTLYHGATVYPRYIWDYFSENWSVLFVKK